METLIPPDTTTGEAMFVGAWLIGLTSLGIAVVMAWLVAAEFRQRFWRRIALGMTLLFVQTVMNAIYVSHATPRIEVVEWGWFLLVYYSPRITTYLLLIWAFGGVLNDMKRRAGPTATDNTETAERLRQLEQLLPNLTRQARNLMRPGRNERPDT